MRDTIKWHANTYHLGATQERDTVTTRSLLCVLKIDLLRYRAEL